MHDGLPDKGITGPSTHTSGGTSGGRFCSDEDSVKIWSTNNKPRAYYWPTRTDKMHEGSLVSGYIYI